MLSLISCRSGIFRRRELRSINKPNYASNIWMKNWTTKREIPEGWELKTPAFLALFQSNVKWIISHSFPIHFSFISYSFLIHFLFSSQSFRFNSYSNTLNTWDFLWSFNPIQPYSVPIYMVPASSKKLAQYKLGKVQSTSLFKLWSGFRNRVNRIGIEWERMSLE